MSNGWMIKKVFHNVASIGTQCFTHKIISDVVKVFAIFVKCFFKEIRF